MKKLLLIISAVLGITTAQAQYLNDGDVVSICFIANDVRYYLEASGNGILTQPYPTDDCLWTLGVDEDGKYTLQDLTTGRYLFGEFTDPSSSRFVLAPQGTVFSFTDQGSVAGKYMYGHLYYSRYYEPWWTTISMYLDAEWLTNTPTFIGHSWTQYTLYIEKWEQKGAGEPTGHFSPSKIEFTYAESDTEAAAQARPVSFEIEATTESYYQCVPRQDEALLRRSTGDVDASQILVTNIYWQSDSVNKSSLVSTLDKDNYVNCPETHGREVLSMSECTYNEQDKKWQFIITPEGASPMGLKDKLGTLERWVDYADNVVVEYTYGGGTTQKAEMRVVRKAYHQEDLPPLTFSINPVTYTFSMDGEEKIFDVVASHQHGTVIYNIDNQVIKTEYEKGYPAKVNLTEANLEFNDANADWLQATKNGESKIKVVAEKNEKQTKRSFTLTGSLKPSNHLDHSAVDFNIELHQRGVSGGIQFVKNAGQSGDALDDKGNQQVHTAERTIYYLPNKEIELRLPESGFSGYMRWYDYETGGDPYYNYAYGKDSTSWILSPRAANGKAFSAINTPKDEQSIAADGESHGLYAINQASGGILNEGDPYNPMPIIKGWNYNTNNPTSACHTMACDVSAYTDYRIVYNKTNNTTRIDTIQEPTLSYRQLFHLRPASEMAEKIANLAEDQYLEEYHYTAPAGKQILLSTEHRYRKYRSHPSELCYFYKDVNGNLTMITAQTPVTWYEQTMDKDGNLSKRTKIDPTYSAEMDYLIVRYNEYPVTKVYTLVVDGGDEGWAWEKQELRIARFEVDFVDIEKYGPTSQTIMTKQRMTNEYEIRSLIDFNYPEKDYPNLDRVTTSDGSVHINQHLPWEQSTYGYVYPSGELATKFKRGADQGVFPFYGEYSIVNEVKKDWARAEQLGGKDKGFALYVDGTMEPGLVASIEANANICEGRRCIARHGSATQHQQDGQAKVTLSSDAM